VLAPLEQRGTPVLALNFLGPATAAAKNFYSSRFCRDKHAASRGRVVADGRLNGVASCPRRMGRACRRGVRR